VEKEETSTIARLCRKRERRAEGGCVFEVKRGQQTLEPENSSAKGVASLCKIWSMVTGD